MREIKIPGALIAKVLDPTFAPGRSLVMAVHLNWPELRLSEEQVVANAVARAYDRECPYPDLNLVKIVMERP